MYDQTWIFAGEHLETTSCSRVCKCATSSRDSANGSGRSRLAAREAFAMATLCEDMLEFEGCLIMYNNLVKGAARLGQGLEALDSLAIIHATLAKYIFSST